MDLLTTFNLPQAVNQANHDRGHIPDWLLHISNDHLVQSTTVSRTITFDHPYVITHLDATRPPSQPAYVTARNIHAIDRPALKSALVTRLSDLQSPVAEDRDSLLTGVLDGHAPAKRRRVCSKENAPWFSDVVDEVRSSKQRRRRCQRQWLKTWLMVHKQIYNNATPQKNKKKKPPKKQNHTHTHTKTHQTSPQIQSLLPL